MSTFNYRISNNIFLLINFIKSKMKFPPFVFNLSPPFHFSFFYCAELASLLVILWRFSWFLSAISSNSQSSKWRTIKYISWIWAQIKLKLSFRFDSTRGPYFQKKKKKILQILSFQLLSIWELFIVDSKFIIICSNITYRI